MKEERSGRVEEASRNSQRPSVAAASSTERLHNRIVASSRRTGREGDGNRWGEKGKTYKVFNRCADISEDALPFCSSLTICLAKHAKG